MSTSTNHRRVSRFSIRFVAAVASAAAVLGGLPTVLVAVALQRFDHASPLHGVNAPWRWNVDDVRSWGRRLTEGLDSSAALVDLFFRLALIVGWICVAVVVYTVVDEMVFQLRHGMPSARHRRLGGLGPLGRRIGSLLIAVLPLAVTATPTLAGGRDVRPAAGIMHDRRADLIGPATTVVELLVAPIEVAAPAASSLGIGWSVVEVQRGDSVWAIADRVADGRDVAVIAQQIVTANLGTVMSDGHRFSTPALIEPGWLLNVPVAGDIVDDVFAVDAPANLPVSGPSYTVVAGDSYWQIAEDHLDNSASNAQIAEYTADLIRINAPILRHSHARLIRPGDVLQLGLQEPDAAVPAPVEAPPPIAVQTAEVAIADTETAPPTAVAPLAPAELPATTVVSPISSQVGRPAPATGQRTPRPRHRRLVGRHTDQARPCSSDAACGRGDSGPRRPSPPTVTQGSRGCSVAAAHGGSHRNRDLAAITEPRRSIGTNRPSAAQRGPRPRSSADSCARRGDRRRR